MSTQSTSAGDAALLRRAKAQVTQFKGQITRAKKFAAEQQQQILLDVEAVKLRIQSLKDALPIYRENQLTIMLSQGECKDDDLNEDDVEELCLKVLADLQNIIVSTSPQRLAAKTGAEQQHGEMSGKLPQLELPTFDGQNVVQYKPFMDMFLAVIGSNTMLASVQKLCYLRKYLKSEALTLIEGLPLVNESYSQALTLLNNRYDNKSILIMHHINILLDLQPITKGTSHSLRQLVSSTRQQLGALEALGQKVEYWDIF